MILELLAKAINSLFSLRHDAGGSGMQIAQRYREREEENETDTET